VIIGDAFQGIILLYIETAPFIYYTENRAGYFDKMAEIFGYVNQGEVRIITSALTLTETLMKPLQNDDKVLVDQYRTMFYQTRGITTVGITPKIGDRAAVLRAKYNLKTPDALHVAVAIDVGCDALLTNDLELKRVTELTVLLLGELELPESEENE